MRDDGDKPGDLLDEADKLKARRRKADSLTKGTDKQNDYKPRT